MSEIKKYIEDGIFKIENISVGPLILDKDNLVPFREINVSLKLNPECKQDLCAIYDRGIEDKIKFNLGSMIVDEIEKSMSSRENTTENQNGHN